MERILGRTFGGNLGRSTTAADSSRGSPDVVERSHLALELELQSGARHAGACRSLAGRPQAGRILRCCQLPQRADGGTAGVAQANLGRARPACWSMHTAAASLS